MLLLLKCTKTYISSFLPLWYRTVAWTVSVLFWRSANVLGACAGLLGNPRAPLSVLLVLILLRETRVFFGNVLRLTLKKVVPTSVFVRYICITLLQ